MSKPLPSPFPEDGGQSAPDARVGSGVPGFVFLSQPQGDTMRPTNRHYNPPSSRANRGHHQYFPHPARFGNGNSYRGSNGNTSPFHNSRGRGSANNPHIGNRSPYGNSYHGNSARGNSYFDGTSSPNGNSSSYGNNSFHSPHGNKTPSGYNSPRGNNSPYRYGSPGLNSSPAHPPSVRGHSPFGSPATPNSSFQSSPFSGSDTRRHRGRGSRGQNSSSNNWRAGRGGQIGPLSEVPPEKFMSNEILQNPWERLISSLDPKQKDVFLAEEEDAIGSPSSYCSDPKNSFTEQPNVSDSIPTISSSHVPSSNIEESNDKFADSWQ